MISGTRIIENLGGRRFIASILVGISTTYLTYLSKIGGETYSVVMLGTVGAYIAGNTIQKVKSNATN